MSKKNGLLDTNNTAVVTGEIGHTRQNEYPRGE